MVQIYEIIRRLMVNRQVCDTSSSFYSKNPLSLTYPNMNSLSKYTIDLDASEEALWLFTRLYYATSKNGFGDCRDRFMVYTKHCGLARSKKYYRALNYLTDNHVIYRLSIRPSVFVINPEYIPHLSAREKNEIESEIKHVSIEYINKCRLDEHFAKRS